MKYKQLVINLSPISLSLSDRIVSMASLHDDALLLTHFAFSHGSNTSNYRTVTTGVRLLHPCGIFVQVFIFLFSLAEKSVTVSNFKISRDRYSQSVLIIKKKVLGKKKKQFQYALCECDTLFSRLVQNTFINHEAE